MIYIRVDELAPKDNYTYKIMIFDKSKVKNNLSKYTVSYYREEMLGIVSHSFIVYWRPR